MIIKGYSNHCDKDLFKFLVDSQSGHRDQARKSFYQIWKFVYFTLIFAISLYLASWDSKVSIKCPVLLNDLV